MPGKTGVLLSVINSDVKRKYTTAQVVCKESGEKSSAFEDLWM